MDPVAIVYKSRKRSITIDEGVDTDGMDRREDQQNGDTGLSRRAVVRSGATVMTIGALGVTGFTGTVSATNFCPRSPGYWGTHWHEKFGSALEIPPAGELTKKQIQDRLRASTKGETVNIMAKQYLATYLNLWLRPDGGADNDTECANKAVHVDGIGMVEWEHVKNAAQAWLRYHGWDGWEHTGQRTWEPTVTVEGTTGEVDGETIKDALDAFNNNRFEQLDCNCDGDEGPGDGEEKPGPGDGEGKPTPIDGCTTITEPGAYEITRDIQVTGESTCIQIEANDVSLDGRGHVIDGGGNAKVGIRAGELLAIGVDDVSISNLRLTGFREAGVSYEDATGGTIRNVEVTHSQTGFQLLNGRHLQVTGCAGTENTEFGFFATDGSSDNVVSKSDFTSNGAVGLLVTEFGLDNTVRQNEIADNGRSGISFGDGSDGAEIVGNNTRDNGGHGIAIGELSNATVSRNRTVGNAADGISLHEVEDSLLVRNKSFRNGDDGISVVDSDNNRLERNVVRNNGDEAISIEGTSSGNVLTGNVTD